MLRETLVADDGARVSQSEFGRRLGELLGKDWSRQAVWMAESGNRAFTAAELVAIAHVLNVPVGQLFDPPPHTSVVDLPTAQLPASELAFERISEFPEALQRKAIELYAEISQTQKHLRQVVEWAADDAQALDEGIKTVAALIALLSQTNSKEPE
ncbi:helix-turn-helix transcriptional regulator [Gordonia alkanivorans]|uniref:helix-turn-helix domain-containing protein n=1 Tax=Gordonia alkanivorans TaxID=84096 RepID=UPI0024B7223B|nr:helix-turn-helix transcriptional regulator [Gordonia alkanivorans]MDJ0027481.1 helix-turn-helix transcriptional regulator [Gordonia alkanivorans]